MTATGKVATKVASVEAATVQPPATETAKKSSGPCSNATNPNTAPTFVRVSGDRITVSPAAADVILAAAESSLNTGNQASARDFVNAVKTGIPERPSIDFGKAIDRMVDSLANKPISAFMAELKAEVAEPFDADPARNRGFTYAGLGAIGDRMTAIEARASVLDLEAAIRTLATDTTKKPTEKADTAWRYICDAEECNASSESIALAKSTYEEARAAWIAERAEICDTATAIGDKDGLLAIGGTKMREAALARTVLERVAKGSDPLHHTSTMEPDPIAAKSAKVYDVMLSSTIEQGTVDFINTMNTVSALPLAQRFEKVDTYEDLAMMHDILESAYGRLGRQADLVPFSLQFAKLEIETAEQAKGVLPDPLNRNGCIARSADNTLRVINQTSTFADADRIEAAELRARVKPLC